MLTRPRRAILWLGVLFIGLQLCWVPWLSHGGYPSGYGFLFIPPAQGHHVDTVRLIIAVLLKVVITGALIYFCESVTTGAHAISSVVAMPFRWCVEHLGKICFGVLAIGGAAWLCSNLNYDPISRYNYEQIQIGWNRAQVERLLGPPKTVRFAESLKGVFRAPSDPAHEYSSEELAKLAGVKLKPNSPPNPYVVVGWGSKTKGILAAFYSSGELTEKESWGLHQ